MPIEIKELVIRAVADEEDEGDGTAGGGGAPDMDVVAECVRQILRILDSRKER